MTRSVVIKKRKSAGATNENEYSIHDAASLRYLGTKPSLRLAEAWAKGQGYRVQSKPAE